MVERRVKVTSIKRKLAIQQFKRREINRYHLIVRNPKFLKIVNRETGRHGRSAISFVVVDKSNVTVSSQPINMGANRVRR
jgi:hypothetical protein